MNATIENMQHELNIMHTSLPNIMAEKLAAQLGLYTFRKGGIAYIYTDECVCRCRWGNRAHTYVIVEEAACPAAE